MDELEVAGKSGYHIKVKPELRIACRRYKVQVSQIARAAIAAAVREAMAKRSQQA